MAKYGYGVIAADVRCKDCEWTAKSYKNAQATAKLHAKRYNHRIEGEITIAISYDYHPE